MTEEEAKTKWCPFSRYAFPSGVTANREGQCETMHPHMERATRCIGSDCMAWREDLTRDEASQGFAAQSGHCGLAGKP